ncbi:MAG: metallophosphoesterase, partial [Planctomycetota bacterium]|nr:metallophosphoesterase [Planctomycetota bacterium]
VLWLKVLDNLLGHEMSRQLMTYGKLFVLLLFCLLPFWLAHWYLGADQRLVDQLLQWKLSLPFVYVMLCWAIAVWTAPQFLLPHRGDDKLVLISNHTTMVDIGAKLDGPGTAGGLAQFFASLPGNQILHLLIHKEKIRIPRLPRPLEGLSITHISDLHFTGGVTKSFFEEVVRQANALAGDIIAITGDIVDREACFDWLPDTLGQLQAAHGVYFVLGNHDTRVDSDRLRQQLAQCGLVDLGGRWIETELRGQKIVLAGNELPWFRPAPDLSDCPDRKGGGPLRILLAHSPDQLRWARRHNFDLMLAGHTHGGQIHLPWTGPVVSATRIGTDYAAGLRSAPPTVLHVSRGISQTVPLRLRCPPELARLTLYGG